MRNLFNSYAPFILHSFSFKFTPILNFFIKTQKDLIYSRIILCLWLAWKHWTNSYFNFIMLMHSYSLLRGNVLMNSLFRSERRSQHIKGNSLRPRMLFLYSIQIHWKEKGSHFDLKSWVTGGIKIWPKVPSNWRIFKSNWLDIESQINNVTLNIESICQIVNFTLNVESIWLKHSPITRNPVSNFSSTSDSTF